MSEDLKMLVNDAHALIVRLSAKGRPPSDPARRDSLLVRLARFQAEHCPPFARLCRARGARFDAPDSWPALPTDVFRYARVSVHPPGRDVAVYRTSGTTSGARGEHPFVDLGVYDRALEAAARHALFRAPNEAEARWSLIMLAPAPDEATDSSLSYMLGRFVQHFGDDVAWAFRDGRFDLALCDERLGRGDRCAVLGTSFAFVLLDELSEREGRAPFTLPAGSFAMQTGGFKGKSRELDPGAMRALVARRFGLPPHAVVSEYGMTELSSQLYGRGLIDGRAADVERLWVPGWVRVTAVDPETLAPLPTGTTGILRIDDAANVHSCVSIQTADRGYVDDEGSVVLLGRMPGAVPRGCSLALDEVGRDGSTDAPVDGATGGAR